MQIEIVMSDSCSRVSSLIRQRTYARQVLTDTCFCRLLKPRGDLVDRNWDGLLRYRVADASLRYLQGDEL